MKQSGLATAAGLLFFHATVFADNLTLTAPYPIPTGQYRELTTVGETALARDGAGVGVGIGDPLGSLHVLAPTAGIRLQTPGAGSWEMRTFDSAGAKAWALRDVEAGVNRINVNAAGEVGIGLVPDPATSLTLNASHGINLIGGLTTDVIFTPNPASPNVIRWRTGTIGDDYSIRAEPVGGGLPFGLWMNKLGEIYLGEWAGPGTPNTGFAFMADNGAFLSGGGTWEPGSRRILKKDIEPLGLSEAERILQGLKPVRYRYKKDPSEEIIGFIAEDTPEPVAPIAHDSINSDALAATLTRIVQDRQRQLEKMEHELETIRKAAKP